MTTPLMPPEVQDKLRSAAFQLLDQDSALARMMAEPYKFGTIVDIQPPLLTRELFEPDDLVAVIDFDHEFRGKTGHLINTPDIDGFSRVRIPITETRGEGDSQEVILVNKYDRFATGLNADCKAQIKQITKDDGSYILVQTTDDKLVQVKAVPKLDVMPGDTVRLSPISLQILGVIDFKLTGEVCSIRTVMDNGLVEVDYLSAARVVYPAAFKGDLERGDRVLLDVTNRVVIQRLTGSVEGGYHAEMQHVEAEDIIGCSDAIEAINEAVIDPILYAAHYAAYNKKPIKGVMLSGAPGVGKTLLGHYAHTQLARHHGVEKGDSGFIYVKGPEILRGIVGASEAEVRSLFARGARHYHMHKYPAILFIDEADAVFPKRGSGISTDINNTIVTTFSSEMSGLNANHVVVLLATNHPEIIDAAILRDGRIDRHIHVPRPGVDEIGDLFELYASKVPMDPILSLDHATARITAELTSTSLVIMNVTVPGNEVPPFCLRDCMSGAMIANLLDRATTNAIKRELQERKRIGGGVEIEDLLKAVRQTYRANLGINHDINFRDYAERHGIKGSEASIEKVSKHS
jgi:proteasome-associated ATPase